MHTASIPARCHVAAPSAHGPKASKAQAAAASPPAYRSAVIPEHRAKPRAAVCRRRWSGIAEAAATAIAPQAAALPQLPPLDGEPDSGGPVNLVICKQCLPAGMCAKPEAAPSLDNPRCRQYGCAPSWVWAPPTCCGLARPCSDGYESACAFTDFANWLIPGRVMLGRYPFVEPSRCRSRDVGEEQLRQLIAAGVTTFISLQVCHVSLSGRQAGLVYRPMDVQAGWALYLAMLFFTSSG